MGGRVWVRDGRVRVCGRRLKVSSSPCPEVCGGEDPELVVPGISCYLNSIFCGDQAGYDPNVAMRLASLPPDSVMVLAVDGFCYTFNTANAVEDDGSFNVYNAGPAFASCAACCNLDGVDCCDNSSPDSLAGYKPDPSSPAYVTMGFTATITSRRCCLDEEFNYRIITATGTVSDETTREVLSSGSTACIQSPGAGRPIAETTVEYDGVCCSFFSPCETPDETMGFALDYSDITTGKVCKIFGSLSTGANPGMSVPGSYGVNDSGSYHIKGSTSNNDCGQYVNVEADIDWYVTWTNVAPCPGHCTSVGALAVRVGVRPIRLPSETAVPEALPGEAINREQGIRNGLDF